MGFCQKCSVLWSQRAAANCQHDCHCGQQQEELPSGSRDRDRRRRRLCRRVGDAGLVPILLLCLKIPAAHPRIQFRPGRVHRAHPVMQVPMDGHPLPLLPPLDRRDVAFEVGRDLLPRIQPVFKRSLGWRCTKGRIAHHALLAVRDRDEPGTRIIASPCGKGTAKDRIRRQVEGMAAVPRLTA